MTIHALNPKVSFRTPALLLALTPAGYFAGFVPLPLPILAAIVIITIVYLAAAEALKPLALGWAPKGVQIWKPVWSTDPVRTILRTK